MSRQTRLDAIKKLEAKLGCPVVTYITSTRRFAEAQMSIDAVRLAYEHLRSLAQPQARIALLVHSNGGEPGTSWRLMNLLREFASEVHVLVPHSAYSAATLLALGADEIVMHAMANLGPTDPSIIGPFNPKDPQSKPLPVSVEDVLSYIALVKDDVKITHEDELIQAFLGLVKEVHPLALGSVKRSHSQARMLAKKLMQLRVAKPDEHKISEVVDSLTSKLYYHGHPINRREAAALGLPVKEDPNADIEELMWEVYEAYEVDMKLTGEFNVAAELLSAGQPPATTGTAQPPAAGMPMNTSLACEVRLPMVYVESVGRCDVFTSTLRLSGTRIATGGVASPQVVFSKSDWEVEP